MNHGHLVSTLRCGLAVLSLSLAGCAVGADPNGATDDLDGAEQSSSALTVGGVGTVELSPATVCASTAADATFGVTADWHNASGASVAGGACDWRVTELANTYGRKVDVVVIPPPADPVVPQNRCAESVVQDVVYGLLPGYYIHHNGGGLEYVPARWEQAATHGQHGAWLQGACHFTDYDAHSTATATGHTVVVRAPYSAMRVATRARLYRADGTVKRGSLITFARTLPLLPGE
ncbi:MAG: hypothetical protein JWM10_3108 [Myxococcaceae bacterium]|nr:hypothetical protein [Myxococcaceae bacterium]